MHNTTCNSCGKPNFTSCHTILHNDELTSEELCIKCWIFYDLVLIREFSLYKEIIQMNIQVYKIGDIVKVIAECDCQDMLAEIVNTIGTNYIVNLIAWPHIRLIFFDREIMSVSI